MLRVMAHPSLMPPTFVTRRLSVEDRVRLLRLTLHVRRLRRRYVSSIKRLRDATWKADR